MVQFTPPTKSINCKHNYTNQLFITLTDQEAAEQYLSEIEVFVDTSNSSIYDLNVLNILNFSDTFKLCTIPLSAIVGVSRLCIPRSMQVHSS